MTALIAPPQNRSKSNSVSISVRDSTSVNKESDIGFNSADRAIQEDFSVILTSDITSKLLINTTLINTSNTDIRKKSQ